MGYDIDKYYNLTPYQGWCIAKGYHNRVNKQNFIYRRIGWGIMSSMGAKLQEKDLFGLPYDESTILTTEEKKAILRTFKPTITRKRKPNGNSSAA